MSRHTRGPWTCKITESQSVGVNVRFEIDAGRAINIAGGQSQEHIKQYEGAILEHECRANAKLMAAAPELLEALKKCLAALERASYYTPEDTLAAADEARAAIAKAEG